jgi:hypothetical protein
MESGHAITIQMRRGQEFVRPVALGDVEPARARRIGHVGGALAGEPETNIVLRQQHLADVAEDLGLMLLHPNQLWRGEAREDDVAGDLAEALIGVELGSLFGGAAVVP